MTSRKTEQKPVFTCYSLYGKVLKSHFTLPLPALPDQKPDITITADRMLPRTLDHCPVPYGREWIVMPDHAIVRFYGRDGHMFEFVISADGSRINVSQTWPVWQDSVFALVNMVLGAALTLHGRSMLHACSLVDARSGHRRAFLIMGESGTGKSSLTLALASGGLAAHADDVAVIHNIRFDGPPDAPRPVFNGSQPVIAPGYPRIKVKPELPVTLGLSGVTPIMIASVESPEKERWLDANELPGGFFSRPAPLGGIFILQKRAPAAKKGPMMPQVAQMAPMPAAMTLTEHIYGRAWFNPPGPRNLFLCTDIAGKVPVYRVTLPDDLALLRPSARFLLDKYIRPTHKTAETDRISEETPSNADIHDC